MKIHSTDLLALDVAMVGMFAGEVDGEPRAAAQVGGAKLEGGVAVIPIMGMITLRQRYSFFGISSNASLDRARARLNEALADTSIAAIVLYIDSPGGTVAGVAEFAAEIRAARAQKPIIAIADTLAASAAYWLGCQATEFVVTPSGMVGSIGIIHTHENRAGMLEAEGVDVTLTYAGKYKVEGNPFEPLSDEAKAALQTKVDTIYAQFVADVAAGRGVRASEVRSGFGEGRVVGSREALALGMVDRVEPVAAAIARIARNPSRIRARGPRAEGGSDIAALDVSLGSAAAGALNLKLDVVASGAVNDQGADDVPEPVDPPEDDDVNNKASAALAHSVNRGKRQLSRARFA